MDVLRDVHATFLSSGICRGIQQGDPASVMACIKAGEDIHEVCPTTKFSFLHVIMKIALPITEKQYIPIFYQLSNGGINLDSKDCEGVTPIRMAMNNSLLDLMIACIKCGATMDPEKDRETLDKLRGPSMYELDSWYKKFSPGYWDAVENDKAFKVNVLVKAWCRVNITRNGLSVIEYARKCGACEKIIKMLSDNETTIDLTHAIIAGDEDQVRHILRHYRVDLETKDMLHRENFFAPFTPLTLKGAAELYGHNHLIPLLTDLENKKDVHDSLNETENASNLNSVVCVLL